MLSILTYCILAGSDITKSQCKHHIESTSARALLCIDPPVVKIEEELVRIKVLIYNI